MIGLLLLIQYLGPYHPKDPGWQHTDQKLFDHKLLNFGIYFSSTPTAISEALLPKEAVANASCISSALGLRRTSPASFHLLPANTMQLLPERLWSVPTQVHTCLEEWGLARYRTPVSKKDVGVFDPTLLNGLIPAPQTSDLSLTCPVVVQSVKTGQTPVVAFVTVVLPHQLILELELRQSAEGAPPEQVGLDRCE